MGFTNIFDNGENILKAEGVLDINEAAEFRDMVLSCIGKGDFVLDLEDVAFCDLAGLQIICSAEKTVKSKGGHLIIRNLSESVVSAYEAAAIGPGKTV